MSEKIADDLHAFIAAAPHKYPGHLIELFDRAEKALRRCSADSVRDQAFKLTCDEQFDLAGAVAANVGYVLEREPDHPDSPHATEPQTAPTDEQIEAACVAYALAIDYYIPFHRGLSSESSDRIRKGMRAALATLSEPRLSAAQSQAESAK